MSLSGVKTVFKNPKKLFPILGARGYLKWMPDEIYIKILYRIKMKKKLNLKNPITFNEKLQWLKLHDRKPIYTTMVDKWAVKQYVANLIGEEYIIPTLGVWESFDGIDFDALPDQFVLKCTHDSGGLVICRDKVKLDKEKARRIIDRSFKRNFYNMGREWPYKDITPKIIAEAYMEDENPAVGLTDYKFFCFNGKPKALYVSEGLENHATARISFFDMEGKQLPFRRDDYAPMSEQTCMPANLSGMAKLAETLAQSVDCPFVRIDLYSISGRIYFSEITFFPCGGMLPFNPPHWDNILGQWIALPTKQEHLQK